MKKENLERIINLRHELHQYPQLSMNERETLERLMSFLRENTDFYIEERNSWFYAVKHASEGINDRYMYSSCIGESNESFPYRCESIAFRADVDALPIPESDELSYHSLCPGISHRCGHDGHAAVLCGLALELDKAIINRDIYLIFQPGEETGHGGKLCSVLLEEKRIGQVYAFHNLPGYEEGVIIYRRGLTQPASEGLEIVFEGKTSHASEPENGINPSDAIARLVLTIPDIAANIQKERCFMLLATVVGVQIGRGDFGVNPGEGNIRITIRSEYENDMLRLEAEIRTEALRLANQYGMDVKFEVYDYFPETRNDDECLNQVIDAANKLMIPVKEMKEIWRASEDFGYYTKVCPGAIFYIGAGENYASLHTAEYDFNDRLIEKAVDMFLELYYR